MPAVINTNISSLNAQRNLTTSQSSLATSLQRLSSGLRINSAKDDAAGLAISDRFTSQIKGLTQAARNANDGISLAQTAEGALSQVGDALQRIRELSVQSANATNSSSDRAALQQEVGQLVSEIGRIGDTTAFNGLKILDGSYTNQQYQIGANAGETINVSVGDSRSSKLGATTLSSTSATGSGAVMTPALYSGALVINGQTVDTSNATTAADAINAINTVSGKSGVTAARATTNTLIGAYTADAAISSVTINGTSIAITAGATIDTFAAAINTASAQTGVTAKVVGTDISFSSANAADFSIAGSATTGPVAGVTSASQTFSAGITLSTKLGGSIDASGALATSLKIPAIATFATDKVDLQVSTMDISTVAGANKALAAADAALTQVSSSRAGLGAIQNRFSAVVTNLSTASENFSASRSRILDTDFAAETANLTRGQILQQAGTAMLAQANSLPNGVLALLRG